MSKLVFIVGSLFIFHLETHATNNQVTMPSQVSLHSKQLCEKDYSTFCSQFIEKKRKIDKQAQDLAESDIRKNATDIELFITQKPERTQNLMSLFPLITQGTDCPSHSKSLTMDQSKACKVAMQEWLISVIKDNSYLQNQLRRVSQEPNNKKALNFFREEILNKVIYKGRRGTDSIFQEHRNKSNIDGLNSTLFNSVKSDLLDFISSLRLSKADQKVLISKINRILPVDCSDLDNPPRDHKRLQYSAGHFHNAVSASYNFNTERISFCKYFRNPLVAVEEKIMVMIHEFSHSFNSCEFPKLWSSNPQANGNTTKPQNPLGVVNQCLKSASSVNPKTRNMNRLMKVTNRILLGHNINCSKNSQIGEVNCDWVSAERLISVIRRLYPEKNNIRPHLTQALGFICQLHGGYGHFPDAHEGVDFLVHPSFYTRMDKIFMANPNIRKELGCKTPSNVPYCSLPNQKQLKRNLIQKTNFEDEKTPSSAHTDP